MNLSEYLTKHDGKPRSDGPELIRLAAACRKNAYYLYLTALGHKRVGELTARCLSENSIGGELDALQINNENAKSREVKATKKARHKRG